MNDLLHELFRYHTWATLQLIDYCGLQPAAQLQELVVGTDRTILHTLTHLIGSEQEYLQALAGEQFAAPIRQGEVLALSDARHRCEELLSRWETVLDRINQLDLILPAEAGRPETPHAQGLLVLQALQHGMDHRTQINTTLHALGLEPPTIDGWSYWLAMHRSNA